jgi:hypothetical protein
MMLCWDNHRPMMDQTTVEQVIAFIGIQPLPMNAICFSKIGEWVKRISAIYLSNLLFIKSCEPIAFRLESNYAF